MPTLVHLIYVHGFQGNDTTFQHLQEHLSARIPPNLDITFQTSLYPTYRSVKPLSYAVKNFLEWLTTQPPGPVILLGHSMGGLLVADAATHHTNNPENKPGKPKRIIGLIAFDTPYLGMHPHVVVSGIASLLPKGDDDDDDGKKRTEGSMNDHPDVNVVDGEVTDDWEKYKKQENIHPRRSAYYSDNLSAASASTHSVSRSPSPSPTPTRTPSPTPFVDKALSFISSASEDPIVRWLRKHSDEPFTSGKRWIVERCQFGVAMFDPQGLTQRYSRLVDWKGGVWVNYWTETVSKSKARRVQSEAGHDASGSDTAQSESASQSNDVALVANGIVPPDPAVAEVKKESSEKALLAAAEASDLETPKPPAITSTDSQSTPTGDAPPLYTADPPLPEIVEPVHTAPTKSEHQASQKAEEKARKDEEKARKEDEKRVAKARKDEEKRVLQAKKDEEKRIAQAQKDEEKARKDLDKAEKERVKALKKQEKEEAKNSGKTTARHFVTLPNGMGEFLGGMEKWERVPIGGVEDEVSAHMGLFIPGQNLDYEGFVERVGTRVMGWCEALPDVKKA